MHSHLDPHGRGEQDEQHFRRYERKQKSHILSVTFPFVFM